MGTLTDARRKLWQAITTAEDVLLDDQSDSQMQLRAVHALTQATTAYAKLVEVGEQEARLAELESIMDSLKTEIKTYNGHEYAAQDGTGTEAGRRTIFPARPRRTL